MLNSCENTGDSTRMGCERYERIFVVREDVSKKMFHTQDLSGG